MRLRVTENVAMRALITAAAVVVLSNPDMVPMYRMSPQQYVAAVGCSR